MRKCLLMLFATCLAMSACAADDTSSSLIGSWKLTAFGSVDAPIAVVHDSQAQFTFDDKGSVSGNSGCNGFGGSYEVDGDQITFLEIVSTLMACDSPVMEQEAAVFQVITGTANFKIEGNTLTLTNNGRVLILTR